MSRAARPPAVTRHVRSFVWLPVVVVGLAAFFFVTEDLPASRPVRYDPDEHLRVRARMIERGAGGDKVRYYNELTEQVVVVELWYWDASLMPDVGERAWVLVHRDNPTYAEAEGDAMPLSTNAAVAAGWVFASLLPLVLRRGSVRRTERLMASAGPSFAMVGVVAPRRLRSSQAELHLYALDAPAGSAPVCSVPVLTTGHAPLGRLVAVEVKGAPRPLGRVVARVGERVLWPAGRALRTADYPRPAGAPQAVAGMERATAPPVPPRGRLSALSLFHWEYAAAGGALLLAAVVAVVVSANAADARRTERSGVPVVAEVAGYEGDDTVVVLRYTKDGKRQTTRAAADFASDYKRGVRYPVRLDPDNPARARLVTEPYDVTEPNVWATLPLAAALGLSVRRLRQQRANERVARAGPWWRGAAFQFDGTGLRPVVAVCGMDGAPVCGAAVTDGAAAGLPVRTGTEPVVVAGDAEPGAPLFLWREDGSPMPAAGPATAEVVDEPAVGLPADGGQSTAAPGPLPLPVPSPGRQRMTLASPLQRAVWAVVGPSVGASVGLGALWWSPTAVVGVAMGVGAVVGLVRAVRIALVLEEAGVVVRNPLRSYRLSWPEVARLTVAEGGRGEPYVAVERTDGRTVAAMALQVSMRQFRNRPTRRADLMLRRVEEAAHTWGLSVDFTVLGQP